MFMQLRKLVFFLRHANRFSGDVGFFPSLWLNFELHFKLHIYLSNILPQVRKIRLKYR